MYNLDSRIMKLFPMLVLDLALVFSPSSSSAKDFFVPPPPSSESADSLRSAWVADGLGEHPALVAALIGFQREPTAANGIEVLRHYRELSNLGVEGRANLFNREKELFQSLCALKLDVIDAGRAAIPDVDHSVRFGSSGAWYQKWVDWRNGGEMPELDPAKQFASDDDLMNVATKAAVERNPGAHELVNGESAREYFKKGVRGRYGAELDPEEIITGFLSPTGAWPILQKKQNASVRWPNDLPAWILADKEKYNGNYAVEQIRTWIEGNGYVTTNVSDPVATTGAYSEKESELHNPLKGFSNPGGPARTRAGDVAVWVANNNRQIFHNHGGDTQYLAKYIVRDIDAWEKYGVTHSLFR